MTKGTRGSLGNLNRSISAVSPRTGLKMVPETGARDEQNTPRNYSPAFKAQVALEAVRGDKTIAELAQKHDLHPTQINESRKLLHDRAADVGEGFFARRAQQGGIAERKKMIDRDHNILLCRQAQLLDISRGSVYYQGQQASQDDLKLMRRIDEPHLNYPFVGSRILLDMLRLEGFVVGRRHVRTLMRRMGM